MNNILFATLRCKQEWTCSCIMSTATLIITRCTRGNARSFFCTYKTYLYAQNYFLKNIFKYCFKSYIKLHEYANCNSANYDV